MSTPGTRSWRLAIDFGTVFTTAAISRGGRSELVDVEGDGTFRLHSGVLLQPSGSVAVGAVARHEAQFLPERYEPTPKRSIGDAGILLGDRMVPMVEVVAAVYVKVITEARRYAGGGPPDEVFLTHPADWATARIGVITEAARAAGLPEVVLVPEPVGAAVHIGAATAEVGRHVAIYDLGGGTFDAAVLKRTRGGYEVAGPPGGKDPLGGADIDQRIIDHLGQGELGQHESWSALISPQDTRWRHAAVAFREAVSKAKEGLSTTMAWQLWVPGIERDVQLTRAELEDLIRADIDTTVDILSQTIAAAGVTTADLAGIYLVGGSSRIPLIAQTIWERLGTQPHTYDDPKAVVVLGAVEYAGQVPAGVQASATMVFRFSSPPASAAATSLLPLAPAPVQYAAAMPVVPPPQQVGASPPPYASWHPAQAPATPPPPQPPRAYAPPPPPFSAAPPRAARGQGTRTGLLQSARGRALAAATGVLVIAAAVVLVVALSPKSSTASSSSTSTSSSAQPLTLAQLGQLAPSPQDIGSDFTQSSTRQSLGDLRLCGQAPTMDGLAGEASTVAANSSFAVVVDVAQFQSAKAGEFIDAEKAVPSTCNNTWILTDPTSGQPITVKVQEGGGGQIGDQTYRVEARYSTSTGASSVQDIVLARSGDVLVTVVVQGSSGDPSRADSLASATIDKVRSAGG
jgi:molecular chaperone DnaK